MVQNAFITCPSGIWTKLNNADLAGDLSIALIDGAVVLQASAAATLPDADANEGLPLLSHGDGWSEATILEKFPGVTGADNLFAKPLHGTSARVYITHGA